MQPTTDVARALTGRPPVKPPGRHSPHSDSGARRSIRMLLFVFLALAMVLAGLLTLVLIGVEVGVVAFGVGITMALLPAPLYVAMALWIDRYEPEPRWLIVTTFFWGASIAVFVALILNTAGQLIVGESLGNEAGEIFAYTVSAPVVEESAKAAVLLAIFFFFRDEFNGVIDGIVYAAMVGLGFAMTENVLYYGKGALEEGVEGAAIIFVMRGLFSPFAHPLFTAMTGIGIGLATQTRNWGLRILYIGLGLGAAMFLHSLWNASAGTGLILGTYFLIFIPVFVCILLVVVFGLRREGQLVRRYLERDVHVGLFNQDEVVELSKVGSRFKGGFAEMRSRGRRGRKDRLEYQRTAAELAFHRYRVEQGLDSRRHRATSAEDEQAYRQRIWELRRELGLPDPRPPVPAAQQNWMGPGG